MLTSLRSAMVICATLVTVSVAPAQADPGAEPLIPATSASLPQIRVPDLLDPSGEPELAQPIQPAVEPDSPVVQPQPPKVAATGDLGDMVTQLMASQPGRANSMSRHRNLLRIEERAIARPACGRQGHRQPRQVRRAVPVILLRRAVPARPILVHPRPQPAVGAARRPPVADRGGDRANRRSGLKASAAEGALFFHARYVSPGWRLKRIAMIGNHIFYR